MVQGVIILMISGGGKREMTHYKVLKNPCPGCGALLFNITGRDKKWDIFTIKCECCKRDFKIHFKPKINLCQDCLNQDALNRGMKPQ